MSRGLSSKGVDSESSSTNQIQKGEINLSPAGGAHHRILPGRPVVDRTDATEKVVSTKSVASRTFHGGFFLLLAFTVDLFKHRTEMGLKNPVSNGQARA